MAPPQFPQRARQRSTRADSHLVKGGRKKKPRLSGPARYPLVESGLPFLSSLATARGLEKLMRKQQGTANLGAHPEFVRLAQKAPYAQAFVPLPASLSPLLVAWEPFLLRHAELEGRRKEFPAIWLRSPWGHVNNLVMPKKYSGSERKTRIIFFFFKSFFFTFSAQELTKAHHSYKRPSCNAACSQPGTTEMTPSLVRPARGDEWREVDIRGGFFPPLALLFAILHLFLKGDSMGLPHRLTLPHTRPLLEP